MARVVYVEPDEEITDLVQRVRASQDPDLVFVLPNRSRVLQSPLNLRLLQQYVRSFSRSASIVSGDARVQGMAREAGFTAYASVAAYERGVEASRREPVGVGAGAATMSAPSAPSPAAPLSLPVDEEGGDEPGFARPVVGTGAATAAAPRPVRVGQRPAERSRRRLYLVAGALFVAGLLLLFLVAPSANVVILLQAQPVSVQGQIIQGTADPAQLSGDMVLTKVGQTDESQGFQAAAHGQKVVPAAPAQTQVIFKSKIPNSTVCEPASTGLVVAKSGGSTPIDWVVSTPPTHTCTPCFTSACVPVQPPNPGDDTGPASDPVGVTARTPGAPGNVAAGAINMVNPQVDPCTTPENNCKAGQDFTVQNPAAATQGVDQKTLTVVTQADIGAINGQVDSLRQQLQDRAKQDLMAKQPGYSIAVDPSGKGLTVASDVTPAVPAVGDQFAPTNITVSVHAKAALYDANAVRAKVVKQLQDKARERDPNASLCSCNRTIDQPQIQQAGDDGVVVFVGNGNGFGIPAVDQGQLRDSFTGKGRDSVRQIVVDRYGKKVQDVKVSQTIPFFVLPLFGSRIAVNVCVLSPGNACS